MVGSGVVPAMNEMRTGAGADRDVHALTATVGARIRAARKASGLSRRELSERSDVSQRYLAQIEAGEGNISIALLMKVGRALDQDIVDFLGPGTDAEDAAFARKFRNADVATRQSVMALLDRGAPERRSGIALIGLRGAGKSTLGRRAAGKAGLRFVELNDIVEEEAGMPVADVMALYGQEGYRALERRALDRVGAVDDRIVLAVAGGIVSAPETFEVLLARFDTIWLKAAPEEHMARVRAQGDERPMAGNPDAIKELKAMLAGRDAQYSRARRTLNTSDRPEDEALEELLRMIGQSEVDV